MGRNSGKLQEKEVVYYLAQKKPEAEVKLSEEHTDFKWLSLQDAIELSNFPEMTKVFNQCHEYLSNK